MLSNESALRDPDSLQEVQRLYALIRGDLGMPPGKMAAQAGHAFLQAFLTAQEASPASAALYAADPPGTKVVLRARNLLDLERAQYELEQRGIPSALIVDQGHILPPFFTGDPIVTALGFGPATRAEVGRLTRAFALVP